MKRLLTELVGRRQERELRACLMSRKRLTQRLFSHEGTRNSVSWEDILIKEGEII